MDGASIEEIPAKKVRVGVGPRAGVAIAVQPGLEYAVRRV